MDGFVSCSTSLAVDAVIITLKADADAKDSQGKNYDYLLRFFAPALGVPEDPVTGKRCTMKRKRERERERERERKGERAREK